jgi:hypothetical protein
MALEKVANVAAKAAMGTKVAKGAVKGVAKAGAQAVKEGIEATSKAYTGVMIDASRKVANQAGEGVVNEAIKNAGKESLEKYTAKALSGQDLTKMTKKQLGGYAADLGLDINSKTTKAQMVDMMNDRLKNIGKVAADSADDVVESGAKNAVRAGGSRKRNALIGSVVGGISGAGIGGIAGMATGADEDNQNGMIVTGALAGIAGGAMVGGLFGNNITKIAGGIAKGASNEAVEGGAKGFLKNVGASAQDFTDKIDDIGERISNNISRSSKQEQVNLIKDIKRANPEMTTSQILNDLRNSEGILNGVYSENAENIAKMVRKGNTIGGAAQGAIIGSAGGALVGGVAGGLDEDESFIGGALKGGLVGGTLGGIGGGASGFFNNNARILSNTTANVKSLIGK